MQEIPLPHKTLCFTVFVICCIFLTIFYYDNTIMNYAIPYATEEITFVEVKNDSIVDHGNTTGSATVSVEFTTTTPFSVTIPSSSTTNSKISTATNTSNVTSVNVKASTVIYSVTNTTNHNFYSTTMPNPFTRLPPAEMEYLVSSSKCKIPNFKPFNPDAKRYYKKVKYIPCHSKKLLTFTTVTDNRATLHVHMQSVPSYTSNGVTCCYSNITRVNYAKDPDSKIKLSTCRYFESNTTIFKDPVYVKCLDLKSRRQIYENVHIAVIIEDHIQKKIDSVDNTSNPFSILLIGIDSISRLNFIRSLPKTHKFVESNGWIPLKGYNKMDDNTFPNLMAILTGFNNSRSYDVCNPKVVGKLDKCPIIWYDFRRLGFVTGYAEDSGSINTFNYRKKGFTLPPVDYYFRPYVLGTERLTKIPKDGMNYCTGPETAGERIMNLAKDFSVTFKNSSSFGFFWMNSFSHNNVNTPSLMDDKIEDFLKDITEKGILNNTIVIFLSDHGIRFGDIRLTDTGWLEERLPFIYVSFPNWFKKSFNTEYNNFVNNTYKLTSPYDLHMTLKHILILSGRDYQANTSDACPKCKSLFEEIDAERSCSDAGIDHHWCTCAGYKKTTLNRDLKTKLVTYMLNVIHDIIRSKTSDHRCAKYTLDKVLDTRISNPFSWKNDSYILFQLKTKPKAVFETTIRYFGDINTSNFSISGDISRLDAYNEHSKCVSDAYLRKYCHCSTGEKI